MHDGMPYGQKEPRSTSRSLKGSRPSVPHGTNFLLLLTIARLCQVDGRTDGPTIDRASEIANETCHKVVEI